MFETDVVGASVGCCYGAVCNCVYVVLWCAVLCGVVLYRVVSCSDKKEMLLSSDSMSCQLKDTGNDVSVI